MKFTKICKCCGKEFETNSPQKIYCDGEHYLPCPVCGKPVLKTDRDFTRPPKCCSNKCTHELRRRKFKPRICKFCGEEFIPRTGVQVICDKQHYRNCEICGKQIEWNRDDDPTTCSHECTLEKLRRHSLEKYGTEHPMQSDEVQKNFHEAMKKKYGVEHALQIGKSKEKLRKTCLEKFGVETPCMSIQCRTSQKNFQSISSLNRGFASLLNKLGLETEFEFPLDRKSYDIHILNSNTLIEIDPTYTHSTYTNPWNNPIDKSYHLKKSELAERNGFRCIHIFDWDDADRIILSLSPKTRIRAHNCRIFHLKTDVCDEFLNNYHLQGSCRGQLVRLGLVYNDELVQVMTFGKPRYNKHYHAELLRLCSHPDYQIMGGASKLFHHALEYFMISDVISYCDRSKFNGSVYQSMGMKFDHKTPPQEIWSKEDKKITANLLRQRGYDQLFGANYGKGTSNEELMLQSGWLPVFDCGQYVYSYES